MEIESGAGIVVRNITGVQEPNNDGLVSQNLKASSTAEYTVKVVKYMPVLIPELKKVVKSLRPKDDRNASRLL